MSHSGSTARAPGRARAGSGRRTAGTCRGRGGARSLRALPPAVIPDDVDAVDEDEEAEGHDTINGIANAGIGRPDSIHACIPKAMPTMGISIARR